MIYLSGCVRPELLHGPDVGVILTPRMGNVPDLTDALWAADTGCFAQPDDYDEAAYLRFLEVRFAHAGRCLFATAPDRVGDAAETLRVSAPTLPRIREAGYRAALVAQDGLEALDVPWDTFDVLFIGGSTAWKLSEAAYGLAREADRLGKWTHLGRVNSWRRLKAAAVSGYDSADGTHLAFAPDIGLARLTKWLATLRTAPTMEAAI